MDKVSVFETRRKQRWVKPQSSIPPTPPRSPTIPDLFVDDLLELWSESQQTNSTRHDISFHSALSHLSNDDDDDVYIKEEPLEATEDEDLIQHLLSYVSEDSPPPTNPPSPPESCEPEPELPTVNSMNYINSNNHHQIFLNHNNNTNHDHHHSKINHTIISNNNHHHHHHLHPDDDDDTDAEMEEFNRYPKTEPITEEFTSHIFDNIFNLITDEDQETELRIKTETDITEIKHDCMWAGSCDSDTHQDMYEELFGPSSYSNFDFNTLDIDSSSDPLRLTPDLEDEEEEEEEDDDMAPLRNALSDHSYAFNGIGPIQQHPSSSSQQSLQQQNFSTVAQQQQSFSSSLSCSSSTKHAIQGIVIKEEISEESSTRKTKILVPLKDLMETLQQKSFLVAPLGPGKKVIRLTGNGETVKGVLDFGGTQFKSSTVSCSSITTSSSSLSTSSSSSGGSCSSSSVLSSSCSVGKVGPRKPPSKKMKKAIHKPKQELSPSSPVHSSSHISSHCNSLGNNSSNGKPKKAKTHNNMERMRRIDLRNSFDTLKKLVPSLNKATKCSKVEILKRASEYINTVKSNEKRLLRDEHNLKVKNESLRNRAAFLAANNN